MAESETRKIASGWYKQLKEQNHWFKGYFCQACNRAVADDSDYCRPCWEIHRPRKLLPGLAKEMMRRLKEENISYLALGREYGVSDNAIRKYIRAAGLVPPRKHKEYVRAAAKKQRRKPKNA